MAQILTTPTAREAAKAWFHDVSVAAGVRTNVVRPDKRYFGNRADYVAIAKEICDELINRNFADTDSAIRKLSQYGFCPSLDVKNNSIKRVKPEVIAKYIVYMAQLLRLYWDDTIHTPYEIDTFKKTLLGEVVFRYGQYISAIPEKRAARSSNTSSGTKTPWQPPKSNYKQSGPQSGNVRDLIGQPGNKVTADGAFIYKIIGDNPETKNTPNVFIKPLSASGAAGSTNKIFISSGKGYTDCTCYFDDPNEATTFLNKVINSGKVPSNISNLRVVKNKADSNGYFLVGTEFGTCAISAKTLNEALKETLDKPFNVDTSGWEKATEGYSDEQLNELHTWMRRG